MAMEPSDIVWLSNRWPQQNHAGKAEHPAACASSTASAKAVPEQLYGP